MGDISWSDVIEFAKNSNGVVGLFMIWVIVNITQQAKEAVSTLKEIAGNQLKILAQQEEQTNESKELRAELLEHDAKMDERGAALGRQLEMQSMKTDSLHAAMLAARR